MAAPPDSAGAALGTATIEAVRVGDQDAFETFFHATYDLVGAVIASLGRVLTLVETSLSDVAAETSAVHGIPLQLVSAAAGAPRVTAVFEERPFDGVAATVCRVLASLCDEAPDQTTVHWTSGGR